MSESLDFKNISSHKTPEESPGFLLWRVSSLWRRSIEKVLQPLKLTHPQFVVLAAIGWLTKAGEKVSQAEVARFTGLDPNTTSQVLKSLQTKKFIERKRSEDERRKHPTLTALGAKTLSKALPAVEKTDAEFFARISLNQSSMIKAMQKLAFEH